MLCVVPVILAMLLLVDRTVLWPMLATDLVLVLLAITDAILARRRLLLVERSAPEVFSIGRSNPVTLTLRSTSARRLRVQLTDDLFRAAESDDLPLEIDMPPRGRGSGRYHVRPRRRGAFALGDHWLRYRSPLGLWVRQQRIAASQPVKVYPDVQMVRTYELLARQNREHSMFRTVRRGGETEFERLRDYRRGDEYRAIDWKATARMRRVIAREYQLESNQSVLFVLDGGRMMTAETAGLTLFDHALNATLMLAHVAARNGDRVGLLAFAERVVSYAPPSGGKGAARRVVHSAYHLHPQPVESSYDAALSHLAAHVRQRSLVVLFTQLVDDVAAQELLSLTRGLQRRHLTLVILLRDPDVEALAAPSLSPREPPLETYVRTAAAEVLGWRDRLVHGLRRGGALVLDVLPRQLTPALIHRYLEIKARHLL